MEGFSPSGPVRALETLAVVALGAALVFGGAIAFGLRLADYREPESEEDFERGVVRAEELARAGTAAEPHETDFLELDPYDHGGFEGPLRGPPPGPPPPLPAPLRNPNLPP